MHKKALHILRLIAGAILILIGLVGIPLPIFPGWILIFAGILLMFPQDGKVMIEKIKLWLKNIKEKIIPPRNRTKS